MKLLPVLFEEREIRRVYDEKTEKQKSRSKAALSH